MFFPRLRRQAKWVFLFLALVFAVSFVFFGVGSGASGIGDLLRGNFSLFGSGGGSGQSSQVKKALARTEKHPEDPAAWNALASAYQRENKLAEANRANERFLKLRPKDVSVLTTVANYYDSQALKTFNEAQALRAQAPLDYATVIGISTSSQVGQLIGKDDLAQQVTQKTTSLFAETSTALRKEEQLYKKIARIAPSDPNTQFRLGRLADYVGETNVALAAYRAVVRLAPSDPIAQSARQRIQQLAPAKK
jgi:tetratricopeptide (TPR) repeat protein